MTSAVLTSVRTADLKEAFVRSVKVIDGLERRMETFLRRQKKAKNTAEKIVMVSKAAYFESRIML